MLSCDGAEEEGPGQSQLVYLHGDLSQRRAADFIAALLTLAGGDEPIEAWLSTPGGEAAEMFAIYDVMRAVRGRSLIHTVAIGQVMSSGVLLLAAGTSKAPTSVRWPPSRA